MKIKKSLCLFGTFGCSRTPHPKGGGFNVLDMIKSRLWKHPKIIMTIIFNSPPLDPSVILFNPNTYLLIKNKEIVSFLTLKKYKEFYELKTLYTYPKNRGKNYASKLIKNAIRKNKKLALQCSEHLENFYKKFGFKKTEDIFKTRRFLFNTLLKSATKYKIIAMRK